ncbi:uncharacterized protein [Drosophila suzukii]|uniref:Uncharacterized protein n=1 Tax=Drosophila suzukii TaxID=28584 RepID=A0AB40D968_DROSZ
MTLMEAVPPLGLRIGFRQKLFRWKESEGGDEDRIAPLPSFVKPDVKAPLKFILNKSLHSLLNESRKGMKILEHEETHLCLPQVLRDELISIIIEEAMLEHITISVPDFQALLEEICFVLPSQINVKIDIDFDLMYPGKGFHLLSKWQEFRQKIMCYYEDNIINEHCKAQLLLVKNCTNIDAQDFIIATLLNAVLPSSARFKNEDGKFTRKATILDAQESFVLRLVTINDLDIQLDRVINMYYSSGLKLHPIIIVVGPFDCEINELFLYFDGNLISGPNVHI